MAQTGDPKGDGTGGSTLPNVPAEFNWLPHVRGAVSAAREGAAEGATVEEVTKAENSANSQFFIVFAPTMKLDRKYTVFGRVIEGMQYVDAVARGEPPTQPSRILHAYVAADRPPAYAPPPSVAPVLAPAALAPTQPVVKPPLVRKAGREPAEADIARGAFRERRPFRLRSTTRPDCLAPGGAARCGAPARARWRRHARPACCGSSEGFACGRPARVQRYPCHPGAIGGRAR